VIIKPVDGFNLLVTIQGHKDSYTGEELIGIEEIELALSSYEPVLYIKESQYPNVVLVELTMDPEEAVAILKEAPTTVISKVIPIDEVVKTNMDAILEKTWNISKKKMSPGETFTVKADLRGREHIKSKEELINAVSVELMDKLDQGLDPQTLNTSNPDWIVLIEVVGEDTGISILKPHEFLKKR